MSVNSDDPPHFSSDKKSYTVGYAKPPLHSRFQKGKSGNPRGRKKGSVGKIPKLNEERLKSIILEEAYRDIKVNDGNRQVTISMTKAVVRSIAVQAAKGNVRAQRLFTQMLAETERDRKQLYDSYVEVLIDYKITWENEIDRCRKQGIEPPEPLPHPDDIILDFSTGDIRIKGPMTKEQKIKWDKLRQRKADCLESIQEDEKLLREEPDCPYKDQILDNIAFERRMLAMIQKVIPD